jgi:ketosteroid isomerase-like protein
MSQENVELFRRTLDAFNERDLDGLLALMDDNVEVSSRLAPIEGGYHGHDGVRRWWENLFGAVSDLTIGDISKLRDLGDVTVAVLHNQGHGTASDAPFEETLWLSARWSRGKCIWWGAFLTEDQALEAARLRE